MQTNVCGNCGIKRVQFIVLELGAWRKVEDSYYGRVKGYCSCILHGSKSVEYMSKSIGSKRHGVDEVICQGPTCEAVSLFLLRPMALSWRLMWLFLKAPAMPVTQRCRQSFMPFTSSNISFSSIACSQAEDHTHSCYTQGPAVIRPTKSAVQGARCRQRFMQFASSQISFSSIAC